MRSIISFSWEYNDPESGMDAQYVSVNSDHNDDVEIPPVKVGNYNHFKFTITIMLS